MTDQQVRERAAALHKEGQSYRAISAELGVPKSTIQDWLQSSARRSSDEVKKVAEDRRAHVLRLHAEELSIRAIAYEADISATHAARILREEGLKANGYQG
jgi:transposase